MGQKKYCDLCFHCWEALCKSRVGERGQSTHCCISSYSGYKIRRMALRVRGTNFMWAGIHLKSYRHTYSFPCTAGLISTALMCPNVNPNLCDKNSCGQVGNSGNSRICCVAWCTGATHEVVTKYSVESQSVSAREA